MWQASARWCSPICPRARRISSFCENVAVFFFFFFFFLQEVVAKVAHMTVEAFVLSGSHAVRPMPHNLLWGLASARRRGHSVHEGRAHFLVGEFCQVVSEG